MFRNVLALVVFAATSANVNGQTPVTKHISDFATPGGGGYPNDSINDHQAFVDAAAFFQARHGYGTLILGDGEYIMGAQQLRNLNDPLPGPGWNNHGYPGAVAPQCKSLVAWQEGFVLDSCFNFTIQGGVNTSIRYRDCLYYGTFLRDALTGEVNSAVAPQDTVLGQVVVQRCVTCVDPLILPQYLNIPLRHAEVGTMFTFIHCDSITVRDVELDGNIDGANLGGKIHPDGMQTAHDGIIIWESSRCLIDQVHAHHFGRDGLVIMSTDTITTTPYTVRYPGLEVGVDTDGSGTVLFNNAIENSRFNWNGRQGLSWTGCSGLVAEHCEFNYNGAGRMSSLPGSGLDIEGGGGPMRVRYGGFDDCHFLHNWDAGVLSDASPCYGQQGFTFTDCVMKAGGKGVAVWPSTRGMRFEGCSIYGRVEDLFEQAENIQKNPDFDLVFLDTDFYEEDDQWSYLGWYPDSVWDNHCASGPHKLDLVGADRRANVLFENCDFYTNCRGVIRFLGRPTGTFDDQYPYCPTCDSCGIANNNCPAYSCYSGPCVGPDCNQQDARYMRVTNCSLTSTGRMRCTNQTQVLAVDLTTVAGFTLDIPSAVRGGSAGDTYVFPFGGTTWAPSCFPAFCPAPTVLITDYVGDFPPCLPFYADSVPAWSYCNPAGNLPAPPCGSYLLTKTASPTVTQPDSTVTFTITVCNNTLFANPVQLNEQLPPSFTVASATVWSGADTTLWSTHDTTLVLNNGQCAEFLITGYFTAFGEFTNTVTLDTDTAQAGPVLTDSAAVSVVSACEANTVIPHGAYASSGFTYLTGTVNIQGDFFVDTDVTFQNAVVYMEQAAQIVVVNEAILTSITSTFQACNGVMWKGISVGEGNIVAMYGTMLADAETGVEAREYAIVLLEECDFSNNRVDLGVPPSPDYHSAILSAQQCVFHAEGPLAAPYPGQSTALGAVGYAAFDVHHMSLALSGNDNVIHHKSNGVVAARSDVAVTNCTFHDIQPDPAYNALVGNGAGINCHGLGGGYLLKQAGFGAGASDSASFRNCHWGIYTQYMSVWSSENFMDNVGTAYRVEKSGVMTVDILGNRVECKYHGIDLRFNDGAQYVLVEGNDITFGGVQCDFCKGYTGILVTEGNYAAPDSRIVHNTIRFLAAASSRIGIGLTAADDWLVADNTLLMADNAHNLTGIYLHGCNRPVASCNTVIGASAVSFPLASQAAIRSVMGNDPLIGCNDLDLTTNGILFNGPAPNTEVRGNKLNRHKWALHLDATAVIGLQELKGNLWYNAAATGGVCALYEDTANALNFPFRYNPAIIIGGNTEPPSWVPSNWFVPWTLGPNYDCADDEGENYCAQFHERGKERLFELDVRVAHDSLENDPYTDETKWMLKGRLYKKLDENLEFVDSLQVMADLYDELQGSTTADFKQIDEDQLALYHLDSSVVAQLQENRAQLESLMDLLKDGLEQLGDSTLTPAQRQEILAGISGYREDIRDLSAWNATALQAASGSKILTADGVKTANAGIMVSALVEANQKAVNDVYLATIGKDVDAFTVDQASTLFDIANQCPMLGGNAVFKARSLYWLIDDTQNFDDALLCLPHGIIVKRMEETQPSAVSVVPNPASDEATLVLTRETEVPAYLTLCNTVGSEVLRVFVPKGTVRHAFSTASMAPGMYHYKVLGGEGLVGDGKLSIVR